jgi:hypothetical protein
MRMQKHLVSERLTFDGSQFETGWADKHFGVTGESIVAFLGPLDIISQEEGFAQSWEAFDKSEMLHLVVEHSHGDLEKLGLQHHLLISLLKEKLNHRLRGDLVQRWGQDLFYESAQITISTALLVSSSAFIYVGVCIQRRGPKSKVWGLRDGGVDARELAQVVMDQYIFEVECIRQNADGTAPA